MNALPKISVVTIAFNNLAGLRTTIDSVLAQTYPNIEYIIIDGGSTDGSVEFIRQHKARIAHWVSEPDQGIYSALNKGAFCCTGEWIIFMNSGDDFASPRVVQDVFSKPVDASTSFIYGDHIVKYEDYQVMRRAGDTRDLWTGPKFSHQAVFIRRDVQLERPYSITNRISADFEFLFESYATGHRFAQVDFPIARVSPGGLSDVARMESIFATYRVVSRVKPTLRVHTYFLSVLALQCIKLPLRNLLPEHWIHRYRRTRQKVV